MLSIFRITVLLLSIAGWATTATIPTKKVPSTLYYFSFGDSYTTTAFNINGVQPGPGNPLGNPALGTSQTSSHGGTFAGGINYVGWLATKYNSTFVQAYDFGFGGACINDTSKACSTSIPSFYQQTTKYFMPKYTTNKFWNSNNSIFSIFFGINDIGLPLTTNGVSPGDVNTYVPALLDQYFAVTTLLYNQGARRFMFVGIPPLDRSPYIMGFNSTTVSNYSTWVNTFNGQLAKRITSWTSVHTGAFSATYDYHRWMEGVLNSPTTSGFPNNTCINSNGQSCIWWNNYHVGSRFDDLLAVRMTPAMNSLGFNGSTPKGGYFY